MNCIICGKAGLTSSTSECPQCNSDLSSFQLLDSLERESTASTAPPPVAEPSGVLSWYQPAFWTALVLAGICLVFLFWPAPTRHDGSADLAGVNKELQTKIDALTSSLKQTKERLVAAEKREPKAPKKEGNGFEYRVKPGDSLSKIAYNILGDASRYPEIMRKNGLTETSMLYPGTTLQIEP
jgi:hypothetical protein